MELACGVFLLTGLYPLYRAWRAVRETTLRQALVWVVLAWLGWCVAWGSGGGREGRYLALSVAACAGVAVLGGRRPGAGAWNFVVGGLLLVLCRPFLQGLGELRLEPAHLVLLGGVLAVGVLNYLPTGGGLAAAVLAVWTGVEIASLAELVDVPAGVMPAMLAVVPWLWMQRLRRGSKREESALAETWRRFRDTFGVLWALRMGEQYARALENAGLREADDPVRAESLLRAVLGRFERR